MNKGGNNGYIVRVHLRYITRQLLPHAVAIKEKVDQGGRLDEFDIEFLTEMFVYHKQVLADLGEYQEYHKLLAQLSALYAEIVEKSAANEKE